jgi:hypothetical protein
MKKKKKTKLIHKILLHNNVVTVKLKDGYYVTLGTFYGPAGLRL